MADHSIQCFGLTNMLVSAHFSILQQQCKWPTKVKFTKAYDSVGFSSALSSTALPFILFHYLGNQEMLHQVTNLEHNSRRHISSNNFHLSTSILAQSPLRRSSA